MQRSVIAILSLALTMAAPPSVAVAGESSFKRVRPPSGSAPRINVQITKADRPDRPAAIVAAPRGGPAPAPSIARARPKDAGDLQEWFWSTVSPDLGRVAGRFQDAARMAAQPPRGSGIAAPPLERLRTIARDHGADILRHSVGTGVSPALILALISVESAGRPDAVSHAGAEGLMQLIPDTASRFGVADATDPDQNIRGGVAYLDWLLEEFEGDPVLALAGYNAGEGAVRRHSGVPPFSETRAYVPKVMAAWNVARTMCTTPPELPGDGCVFDRALVGG